MSDQTTDAASSSLERMVSPLPCPFCGGGAEPMQETPTAYWMVYCNKWNCGGRGPDRKERKAAIAAWNKRANY